MALPVRRGDEDLSRWEPSAELSRLNQQLSSYLEGWRGLSSFPGEGFFTPLADVEESEDAYTVELELPGVKKDDVSVEVAGRRVTVSGERKERHRVGVLRQRTRTVGRFFYDVILPGEVDESGVSASLDEGVLSVRVPKAASERARRIPVQ